MLKQSATELRVGFDGMQFGHRLKLSDQPLTKHHMRPPRLQLNSLNSKPLRTCVFLNQCYILITHQTEVYEDLLDVLFVLGNQTTSAA